jgi:hypothetical protein
MDRAVRIVAWGVAGILVMGALTGAAVAAAGKDIARPARPFGIAGRVQHVTKTADDESPSDRRSKAGAEGTKTGSSGNKADQQSGSSSSGSSGSQDGSGSGSSGSSSSGDSQGSGDDSHSSGDGSDGGPDD